MRWRVTLNSPSRNGPLLQAVIDDRRSGGHDLIRLANESWGTSVIKGEVYVIEEIPENPTRYFVVSSAGERQPRTFTVRPAEAPTEG